MARNLEDIQEEMYRFKDALRRIQDLQLIQDALDGIDVRDRPLGSETARRLDVHDRAWREPQAVDVAEIRERLVQFSPGGELDRFFAQMSDANALGEAISQILLQTPISPRVLRGVPPEDQLSFVRFLRDAKYQLLGPAKARAEIASLRKKIGNVEERLGELERELKDAQFGHSEEREKIAALKAGTLSDARKRPSKEPGTTTTNPNQELRHNPFANLPGLLKK